MNRKLFSIVVFIFVTGNFFSQKKPMQVALETGYKFNNDFSIYYKDLKPFYYSSANMSLLLKVDKAEFIIGARYMPFLSAVKPELGFNYYFKHNPESKFNYFLHTTLFYNNFSYNSKVGYENYDYHLAGVIPSNYNEVRFQSFMQDVALGIKMGFTNRLSADFIFGGGYFYGKRDFVLGEIFKAKTKDHYWGPSYTARFSLKFILKHQLKKEEGFEDD